MDKFVVVDYPEGGGGEFIARFISAHFGHSLAFDQQLNPEHIQKWLNSQSLVKPNWNTKFQMYLEIFLQRCHQKNINQIAVPYHLYKYPDHIDVIKQTMPYTRFIKINCQGHESKLIAEFHRKILDRHITDFQELQFLLAGRDRLFVKDMLQLYKQQQLTYNDIFPNRPSLNQTLPSNDIEIQYADFFCDFSRTREAYEKLCSELEINPDIMLLSMLLERNTKNKQELENYLSKV